MADPTLTKEELEILDSIIADAQTTRGIVQLQAGSGRAIAFIAKALLQNNHRVTMLRAVGFNPAAMKMTAAEREALGKAVEDELTKEPTLEDLVALRKAAKIQD
jgi:hypothetical protein